MSSTIAILMVWWYVLLMVYEDSLMSHNIYLRRYVRIHMLDEHTMIRYK